MATTGSKNAGQASAHGGHEIFEAPTKLQQKVGVGQGANQAALHLAEDVLEKVKPSYEGRFEADMRALKSSFVKMQDTREFDLNLLVGKVHEIRGEAGTFGYNLVAEIGRLLSEFIGTVDEVGPTEELAISAHLQAMQTVVVDKVKGEGPEVARQIIAGLNAIMERSKGDAA